MMKQTTTLPKTILKKLFFCAILILCSSMIFSACALLDGSYDLPDEQDAYWPPYQSSEPRATSNPEAASLKDKFLGISKLSHLPNDPMTTKVTRDENEILIADLSLRFVSNGAGGECKLVNSSQAYTLDFDNDGIDETIIYLDRMGFLIFEGEEIVDFLPFTLLNSDYFTGEEFWIPQKYRPEDAPRFTINYLRILDLDKTDGTYEFMVCGQVYATNAEYADNYLTGKLPLTMLCKYDPSEAKADIDRKCEWLNLERLGYVFEIEGAKITHSTELVNVLGYRSMMTTSDLTFYDVFPVDAFNTPSRSSNIIKTIWLVELTDDIPENESLDTLAGFFSPFFNKHRFVRVLSMTNNTVTLEDVHYSTITVSLDDFKQYAGGRALRIDNGTYFDSNIGYIHNSPKPAVLSTGTLTGTLIHSSQENDTGSFRQFDSVLPIETDLSSFLVLKSSEYQSKTVLFDITVKNSDHTVNVTDPNPSGEPILNVYYFKTSILINGIHTEDVFRDIYDCFGRFIVHFGMTESTYY